MCRLCICFFLRQTCLQRVPGEKKVDAAEGLLLLSSVVSLRCCRANRFQSVVSCVQWSGWLAGWLEILVTKAPFPLAKKKNSLNPLTIGVWWQWENLTNPR